MPLSGIIPNVEATYASPSHPSVSLQ